jgi:hypothetical protein
MTLQEAISMWADKWHISRRIGPIADMSHASDTADYRHMLLLVDRRNHQTPVQIERRKQQRRNQP